MVARWMGFCFCPIIFMTCLPAILAVRGKARSGIQNGATSQAGADLEQNLGVKLWTWNSGLKDLAVAKDRLFHEAAADDNIEVVVACQTEATVPLLDFVDESEWACIGHGEHWGFAGGNSNAQMMSVFYRQPKGDNRLLVNRPPRKDWSLGGKGAKGWLINDVLMPTAHIDGIVSATSERHMNSATGKGGISVLVKLEATQKRARTSFSVICGHLDSESESKRDQDFLKLLRDGSRRKGFGLDELWRTPAKLFDNPSAFDKDHLLDAVVILGDLNYRIKYQGAKNEYDLKDDLQMTDYIVGKDRSIAAMDDQLNPDGADPKAFVRNDTNSFRLECNQPYQKYLPTYKRVDIDSCIELNWRMNDVGTIDEKGRELAKKCFVGKLDKPWKLKEQDKYLQTGWLDRVCWRAVDGSIADVQLTKEAAWHDIDNSDHVAITADLNIFHPISYCREPTLQDGVKLHRTDSPSVDLPHPPAVFAQGEKVRIECPKGKALPPTEPTEARCGDGGQVTARTLFTSRQLGKPQQLNFGPIPQCKGVCSNPPAAPQHGSITAGPAEGPLFIGESIHYECTKPFYPVGDTTLTCMNSDKFDKAAPRCFKTMSLRITSLKGVEGGWRAGMNMSNVKNVKVKLFKRKDADQYFDKFEEYVAKKKFDLTDPFTPQEIEVPLVDAADTFLHVELCDVWGGFYSWFTHSSHCKSIGTSRLPSKERCPSCISRLLDMGEGHIELDLAMVHKPENQNDHIGDLRLEMDLKLTA